MSRYSNMSKVAKSGAVDSKYFNNFEKFDRDVEEKMKKTVEFKNKIKELILNDPNLIEQRYYEAISIMLDIKKEFNL